jgi:hypothetical protein
MTDGPFEVCKVFSIEVRGKYCIGAAAFSLAIFVSPQRIF